MSGSRPILDWKTLTENACEAVLKDQNASYDFIREKFKIGVGTTGKLLKRLEKKGLVRRGKKGAWVVIVHPDGTKKDPTTIPEKRRFRKKRQQLARPNSAITDAMKIEFVGQLADLAEGKKALILKAVVSDLKLISKDRKFLDALKD